MLLTASKTVGYRRFTFDTRLSQAFWVAKAFLKMIFDARQKSSKACKGGLYITFHHTFGAR